MSCWHGVWTMNDATSDQDRVRGAYEAHAADLRRYASARLRDSCAAEDLVQEAFLRLAVESRANRYPAQPRAWLYRVILNLIISGARHTAVVRGQPVPSPADHVTIESPECHILAAEGRRVLDAVIGVVAPAGRTSLLLSSEGYSSREIAAVLGRSEGATRTLLCRARKDARRALTSVDAVFATG